MRPGIKARLKRSRLDILQRLCTAFVTLRYAVMPGEREAWNSCCHQASSCTVALLYPLGPSNVGTLTHAKPAVAKANITSREYSSELSLFGDGAKVAIP